MGIDFRVEAGQYLKYKCEQATKSLYIDFLYILEDLADAGKLTENEFYQLRERVLDRGNAKIRELKEEIEKFDID